MDESRHFPPLKPYIFRKKFEIRINIITALRIGWLGCLSGELARSHRKVDLVNRIALIMRSTLDCDHLSRSPVSMSGKRSSGACEVGLWAVLNASEITNVE